MPDFDAMPASTKRFNFELLRQAVERNPTELRAILEHVIKLPEQKLLELTALLEDVTLSNIIEASATVADRLTFVKGQIGKWACRERGWTYVLMSVGHGAFKKKTTEIKIK